MNIKLAKFPGEHLSHFEKVVVGHRGAAALAPKNTLGSFKIACELGCPLIELDVHQVRDDSKKNELIVIHDDTLDRTTNQKGKVSQISLADFPQILTKDGVLYLFLVK
ncbi:MAG: hypothetical protein Ct9H90mP27_4090 [Gammaproteobacteria bacterium]|nr:MAG: hypothetical protein Ct9H90mP27_4090 [Gammaproteobacteria bacterium]